MDLAIYPAWRGWIGTAEDVFVAPISLTSGSLSGSYTNLDFTASQDYFIARADECKVRGKEFT